MIVIRKLQFAGFSADYLSINTIHRSVYLCRRIYVWFTDIWFSFSQTFAQADKKAFECVNSFLSLKLKTIIALIDKSQLFSSSFAKSQVHITYFDKLCTGHIIFLRCKKRSHLELWLGVGFLWFSGLSFTSSFINLVC